MAIRKGARSIVCLLVAVLAGTAEVGWALDGLRERREAFHLRAWHYESLPGAWFLEFEQRGRMVVNIMAGDQHTFNVPSDKTLQLLETIRREAFFDLEESYGSQVLEGPFRLIRIRVGVKENTVTLYPQLEADPRGDQVRRALRVWMAIRGLFLVAGAIDARPEDLAILER